MGVCSMRQARLLVANSNSHNMIFTRAGRVILPYKDKRRQLRFIRVASSKSEENIALSTTDLHRQAREYHRSEESDPSSSSSSSPRQVEQIFEMEEQVEKGIYGCRFLAFLAVLGSLVGSFLCFLKGCCYVVESFKEYFLSSGMTIPMLIEAIDVYLVGTVMIVFGVGLYELFISNLDIAKTFHSSLGKTTYGSSLFGMFTILERPKWLEIKSVNELKTKLGHVIVMVLLVGLVEKIKRVVITTPQDLLCYSASILVSSGGLFLLSKLTNTNH